MIISGCSVYCTSLIQIVPINIKTWKLVQILYINQHLNHINNIWSFIKIDKFLFEYKRRQTHTQTNVGLFACVCVCLAPFVSVRVQIQGNISKVDVKADLPIELDQIYFCK